jgi:hypothetical protein
MGACVKLALKWQLLTLQSRPTAAEAAVAAWRSGPGL